MATNWFGIVVVVICIFLIALTIANIYYFNRVRTGGSISSGTATALAWLNFFFLLITAILLILSVYYLASRGRKIKVCASPPQPGVPVKQPDIVVEAPPVPVVVPVKTPTTVYTTQKAIPIEVENKTGQSLTVQNNNGTYTNYTTDKSGVQNLMDLQQDVY